MKLYSLAVLFFIVEAVSSYHRVCYYTNWSPSRPLGGRFTPEDIDPLLCTHVVFAYARIIGNTILPTEWNDENSQQGIGQYEKVTSLKIANPDLKVLLGVDGWESVAGLGDWPTAVNFRADIVQSVIASLRQKNFDGLDLKWEFPTARRVRPIGKDAYTTLLQALRDGFDVEANLTGSTPLLLTAAVSAQKTEIDHKYDVPELSRLLDMIHVMTFDFHGSWESELAHNSPLYPRTNQLGDEYYNNVQEAMNLWVNLGAASEKLIVGIPLYGRTFTMLFPNETDVGSFDIGMGPAGPFTQEDGFMSYYEICELLNGGSTPTVIRHSEHRVPYLINGTTWVAYDDPESIVEKTQWLKDMKFGGAMMWALDLDDFSGDFCKSGRYPLLRTVYDNLPSMVANGNYITHNDANTGASSINNAANTGASYIDNAANTGASNIDNIAIGASNIDNAANTVASSINNAANTGASYIGNAANTDASNIDNIAIVASNIDIAANIASNNAQNKGPISIENQIVSLLTDITNDMSANSNTFDTTGYKSDGVLDPNMPNEFGFSMSQVDPLTPDAAYSNLNNPEDVLGVNTQIYDISPSIADAIPQTANKGSTSVVNNEGTPLTDKINQAPAEQIPGLLMGGSQYKAGSGTNPDTIRNAPILQEFATDQSSAKILATSDQNAPSKAITANNMNNMLGIIPKPMVGGNTIIDSKMNYIPDRNVPSSGNGNNLVKNGINYNRGRKINLKKRKDTSITDYFGVPYSHVCEYWTVLCFEHIKKVIIHGEHWEQLMGVWERPVNETITTTPDPLEVVPHHLPSDPTVDPTYTNLI